MGLMIHFCLLHLASFTISSFVSVDEQFENLRNALKQLKERNLRLTYVIRELRDDNAKIAYNLRNLKQFVIDVDSYYRGENLEILGVPKTRDEDLLETLHNISTAIKIPFNVSDVSCVWRKHSVSGVNYYKPTKVDSIIVRFVSRTVRNKWLNRGRKYIVIKSKQCLPQLPESDIYINEHLSNTKKGLMKIAKQLEEQNKILYAWSKGGSLYIRRTPNGKAIKIKSVNDLQALGLSE